MTQKYTLSSSDASLFSEKTIGGKAKNMSFLTCNGFRVPEWFVVTTDAFHEQLRGLDIYDKLQGLNAGDVKITAIAEDIQKRIMANPLLPVIHDFLEKELNKINNRQDTFFAVRSSAVGEDAAEASFAGQMDSFLYQKNIKSISDSILACFASAFSDRAIRYRLHHKMDLPDIKTAVIVQRMVESSVSGVFFTAHPVTGSRKHGLISACYGIGEGIVSGVCNTDEFTVELYGEEIKPTVNTKDIQIIFDREKGTGTKESPVDLNMQNAVCLNDAEIRMIIEAGKRISELAKFPQDVEWGIYDGDVYILQTRPVTSLPEPVNPDGKTVVWDNSNIQESYCGVTTPLTFSFANRGYTQVYEETFRTIGVPSKTLNAMRPYLSNLLGLINGRIYYNINNWYRGLLILPSFKTNKADMERMMGLEDPVDFVEDQNPGFINKLKKTPALVKSLYILLSNFRKIDSLIFEYRSLFESEYDRIDRSRLHTLSIAELMQSMDRLKEQLMMNWHTPIINDFYVMMMNGKVHRWLERAGVENPVIVQNNLMSGEEGIESTEPTKFILRMCDYIRSRPELGEMIVNTGNQYLLSVIQSSDKKLFDDCLLYIEKYGDRCMGELKLESVTLRQDPSFLFAVIKNYLSREDLTTGNLAEKERKFREDAETEVFTRIRSRMGMMKLRKFKKDIIKLRHSVKNRENMRLMRTRVFGLARDIYMEIGKQLAFYGLLEDGRDIFYLTVEEIEAYMDGRSVQSKFKPLVASRKTEYRMYENMDLPHHFSTTGPVYHHNQYKYHNELEVPGNTDVLKGIGCYPGIVEQKVKLIFSPQDELNLNGQILCTVRTDPGWAPLFPTAGGIIVERGSTLSHSAVVARELGIPAIVNIPGLTKIIKNGERIRMNGTSGVIERLEVE